MKEVSEVLAIGKCGLFRFNKTFYLQINPPAVTIHVKHSDLPMDDGNVGYEIRSRGLQMTLAKLSKSSDVGLCLLYKDGFLSKHPGFHASLDVGYSTFLSHNSIDILAVHKEKKGLI